MNQLRQLIRVLDALREVTGLYFVWKCSERSWLPLLPEHQRYHCCRYCRAVKESGAAALLGCNRHHAGAAFHLALEKRKPFPLLCPAGVLELVVPVVAGTCRAAIFAGPFLSPEGGRGAGREFAGAYAAMPKQPASAMQQFETLLTALVESFEPESWERKQLPLLPELEFDRMDPRVCAARTALPGAGGEPLALHPPLQGGGRNRIPGVSATTAGCRSAGSGGTDRPADRCGGCRMPGALRRRRKFDGV